MAKVVSGWTEGKSTFLVTRDGDAVSIKRLPARWSFFATGLDEEDRYSIGRDRRVTAVTTEGVYTRVDCTDRWGRADVIAALERAKHARRADIEILEGDVKPVRRLMSDVGSLEVDPAPRLAYFDIEVDSRQSFRDMREGRARVLSWAVVDEDGELVAADILATDSDDSEADLLHGFFDRVRGYDCLLAWNGDGFDFEVLRNRMEALGESPCLSWFRWTWLDHLKVFKKYNMHSDDSGVAKVSYALDHVANYLLGEGKSPFDASKTWEAWEAGGERRQALLEYNIKDVKLMQRVESRTGYLSLHLAVCHICRVFPDTSSLNATQQGDGFLLRLGAERGYRWPTKQRVEAETKFAGAYVMEPRRLGAIDNVHVADFAGLYPSIMRTFNMGLDTMIDSAQPGACQLPGRDTYFSQRSDGMFRIALDRLVGKRAEYQTAMKQYEPGTAEHEHMNRLSKAFKIVANSFYGICGSPFSRFFNVEIAEGVTQTGKWLLQHVIESAKAEGFDPFYGDTDSVFVAGDGEKFSEFVSTTNDLWADVLRPWGIEGLHYIDLDFEKTFKRIIMVSAKRYAGSFAKYKGKDATGTKPEVKGLEFKRGDTLAIAREFQTEVVLALLEDELPDANRMWGVVERWRARVLKGELSLQDVVLSQSLSRPISEYCSDFTRSTCKRCGFDFGGVSAKGPGECSNCGEKRAQRAYPAHVRVAMDMELAGKPVQEGGRVSYLVVGSGSGTGMQAVAAYTPGAFEKIDRVYYWTKRVYPPTQRLLEIVYPDKQWGETSTDRKLRKAEGAGQRSLFGNTTPVVRRRLKRRVDIVLWERPPGECSPANAETSRKRLLAIRAAIEANPGDLPVVICYRWKDDGNSAVVEAVLPVGPMIASTEVARRSLERVLGKDAVVVGLGQAGK